MPSVEPDTLKRAGIYAPDHLSDIEIYKAVNGSHTHRTKGWRCIGAHTAIIGRTVHPA